LEGSFNVAKNWGADALIVLSNPLGLAYRTRIAELTARAGLPTIYLYRAHVDAGGLISYGPDLPDMCRRAGGYVARILAGAKPADLPVERPARFDMVVNLRTAKALGITIPETLLVRADEVIEWLGGGSSSRWLVGQLRFRGQPIHSRSSMPSCGSRLVLAPR
jgi:putative ABC transport system substrate-binding protein